MSLQKRSPLQDQVVRDLIDSRAIDFEVIGNLFGKYGAQAAREGDSLVSIVTKNVMWNCGWPGPEIFHLNDVRTIQR